MNPTLKSRRASPASASTARRGNPLNPWSVPLLEAVGLSILSLALLWWCWGRACDLIFDFGRDAYVAWQICQGKVLFTDLTHLHGPLSPYVNATVFRLLGPSIASMAIGNAFFLACLVGLMYQILGALTTPRVRLFCIVTFLLAFAFADYCQDGNIGNNFNFIYPYATEATHGVLLCFAAIASFGQWLSGRRQGFLALSGLLLGSVLLTKPDIFIALALALLVGLVLATRGLGWRGQMQAWCIAVGATLIAPAIAWAMLSLAMSPEMALRGTLNAILNALDRGLVNTPFYRQLMGTLNLPESLARIAKWLALYAAILLPAAWIGLRAKLTPQQATLASVVVGIAAAALAAYDSTIFWVYGLAPVPVILVGAAAVTAWRIFKQRDADAVVQQRTLLLVMLVFSLGLMLKIFFNVTIVWYGFTLAMPATLMLIVIMLDRIPTAIKARGGNGNPFRAAFLGPCLVFLGVCLSFNQAEFNAKTARVSNGVDTFHTYPRFGNAVSAMLKHLASETTADQTVIVMPEGAMINLLARRVNPTPYFNFNTTEMAIFGEDKMLAALQAHPPDFVVWHEQDMSDFGFRRLGEGYGEKIVGWIQSNYDVITPPVEGAYPMRLAKRHASPAATPTMP